MNVVSNPSFDTDLNGWDASAFSSAVRDVADYHSAPGSMKLVCADTNPKTLTCTDAFVVRKHDKFKFSLWLKTHNRFGLVRLVFKLATGLTIFDTQVNSQLGWQHIDFAGDISPAYTGLAVSTQFQIKVYAQQAGDEIRFDDASFEILKPSYISSSNQHKTRKRMKAYVA